MPTGTHPPSGTGSVALLENRDFAGKQILGKRDIQEDSYGVVPWDEFSNDPADLLIIVADGMGGHSAGEVASGVVVESFAKAFWNSTAGEDNERLWEGIETANRALAAELRRRGNSVSGMGSTLLAVLIRGRSLRFISVGDSPLYIVRPDGTIERINKLHSEAAILEEKVLRGEITSEQARSDPARHTLLSALIGESRIYDVDDRGDPIPLQPGDVIIAATDGIETLTPGEMRDAVRSPASCDAASIAEALLHAVTERASPKQDNVTVVVTRLPDHSPPNE